MMPWVFVQDVSRMDASVDMQELKATITEHQEQIEALMRIVKEQATQIQKVSAQLELSRSTPQTVLTNR